MALIFAAVSGTAAAAEQTTSAVESRITAKIDESRLSPLRNAVHPLANARNDRGAAPDGMKLNRMHLVLKRSGSQEAALQQLIHDMHTPGTAGYHQWLTPEQFGKQFGPSDHDVATVETWLTSHGFSVSKVNAGKQTIEFSGNVGQMRSAFHTQIHKYEVNGQSHYANATIPQIPAALAPVIGGFVTMNNFQPKSFAKYLGKASYDPRTDKAKPDWTVGGPGNYNFVLAPGDFAVQYDLNPVYSAGTKGDRQSIAIVNESNINIAQVNNFRTLFGLPANAPQVVIDGNDPGIDGINNPEGPNGASVEAYLDVEWAGAVAPNATVNLVIGGDTELESGLILAAERAVYSNIAPVISLSFGECEYYNDNSFFNQLWEQAAAQGITVMVSSGDNGSAGCDDDNTEEFASDGQQVNGFASTPYNVAVGGTDFYYSAYSQGLSALQAQLPTYWNETVSNSAPAVSIKGVIPEQPWNDSQYGLTASTLEEGSSPSTTNIVAGSGGASSVYTKPAWQTGKGVPADSSRDLPDVSLFASNGANMSYYPICAVDGDCQPASNGYVQFSGVGGTSASSPAFAGVMALVNEKFGRQGQADYVLYSLATQYPAAFHDVTVGTNTVPCDFTDNSLNCISVANPVTVQVTDEFGDVSTYEEGEIGTGTTADYNATVGYDLASGLGTVDVNQLLTNWGGVKFTGTTTTLTPSQTTFKHGTAITVSGTVTGTTGTPTGDVALVTSNTDPNQQGQDFFTLSGGSYTGSVPYLPGGTYNIWGQYGGDANSAPSKSTPVQITVSPESSTLNLTIYSPEATFTNSSTPGTNVDYGTQFELSGQPVTASVLGSRGDPTGTVTFKDGSSILDVAVLNEEGDAEYNAPFTVGSHSVSASYSGDASYQASAAAAIPFTVVKDTPVVQISSSNLIDYGDGTAYLGGTNQPTILNVVVENNAEYSAYENIGYAYPVPVKAPTGTITLSGLPSGVPTTATLAAGTDPYSGAAEGIATFNIPGNTTGGNYTANVTYPGDGNYTASSGSFPVLVVTPTGGLVSTTAATVSGSISPTTSVTVKGTVTGQSGHAAPTGDLYLFASGYYVADVVLTAPSSGDVSTFALTLNSNSLLQGANFITVQYFGDTTYYPSAITLPSPNPIANPQSDFTLVPESSIVAVAAPGDSGTVPILLSSENGFTGAVTLTATSATGVGITLPASVTLSSGGSQTANLALASSATAGSGTFNVRVTATDSSGKYVHTAGLQLVVGGNAAPVQGFTLSNTGNLTLEAGLNTANTSTITVTPSNGFNSAVALTCTVTSPAGATSPATCALASPTVSSGSGSDVLTVSTTSTTTPGTYKITVTGTSGALTETTTVTAVVGAEPTFTLSNSGNISIPAGATTGNTSTITVTAANGFASAVSLACSVASPSGASSPATCALASSSVTGGAGTDVLTVTTSSSTTAGVYTVTVTGTSGSLTETTVVTATVTADPTFTLTNSGNISIAPGATTGNTSTITVTPANGFTGTVNLSCAISPTAASDPATCSLATSELSGGTGTSLLSVSTTAATSARNQPAEKPTRLLWPSAGGAALALVCFFGIPARRRRNWMAMLALAVFFASVGAIGCGGGGGSGGGGGGNTGTTAGTYTVTVTGTATGVAGTITQTTAVTLTVQ